MLCVHIENLSMLWNVILDYCCAISIDLYMVSLYSVFILESMQLLFSLILASLSLFLTRMLFRTHTPDFDTPIHRRSVFMRLFTFDESVYTNDTTDCIVCTVHAHIDLYCLSFHCKHILWISINSKNIRNLFSLCVVTVVVDGFFLCFAFLIWFCSFCFHSVCSDRINSVPHPSLFEALTGLWMCVQEFSSAVQMQISVHISSRIGFHILILFYHGKGTVCHAIRTTEQMTLLHATIYSMYFMIFFPDFSVLWLQNIREYIVLWFNTHTHTRSNTKYNTYQWWPFVD